MRFAREFCQTAMPDVIARSGSDEAIQTFTAALDCFACARNDEKRKRNAGRRISPFSAPYGRGSREASRARLPAFHHGACGSDRTPPLNSSHALPGTGLGRNGRYPLPAVHSAAGYPAGRSSCRPGVCTRSRPGAEMTKPHPREPLSLRPPGSPVDVLYGSEMIRDVTETVTNVKPSSL
jgi:hypothetical protein